MRIRCGISRQRSLPFNMKWSSHLKGGDIVKKGTLPFSYIGIAAVQILWENCTTDSQICIKSAETNALNCSGFFCSIFKAGTN